MNNAELLEAINWACEDMNLEKDPGFIKKVFELDMTF
jgi:hypothetical protein